MRYRIRYQEGICSCCEDLTYRYRQVVPDYDFIAAMALAKQLTEQYAAVSVQKTCAEHDDFECTYCDWDSYEVDND